MSVQMQTAGSVDIAQRSRQLEEDIQSLERVRVRAIICVGSIVLMLNGLCCHVCSKAKRCGTALRQPETE